MRYLWRKLNELISDQLENPDLDVNYVATQMAMSRASLYNKLKVLTDVSIGDYINKFRMARVMELLADKDLSILEVSERAGSLTRGISARYLNRCTERLRPNTDRNISVENLISEWAAGK